jgi:hypothetical protein
LTASKTVADDIELRLPFKFKEVWLLLVLVALDVMEFNNQRKGVRSSKDGGFEVELRRHACLGGGKEASLGRFEPFEEALAVGVLIVDEGWIGQGDAPEFEVPKEKAESCQHAIAFGSEGSRGTALGAATALPQYGSRGGNAPAKGAAVGSAAVVSDEQSR